MDDGGFFVFCLISMCVCGGLGFAIGNSKNQAGLGAALGLLLGPLGVIIAAILPAKKEEINCPTTYSMPEGVPRAVAYPNLGTPEIVPQPKIAAPKIVTAPRAPRFFVCAVGGEVRGPYTGAEISTLRIDGEIDDSTLFCAEGSESWAPAPALKSKTP